MGAYPGMGRGRPINHMELEQFRRWLRDPPEYREAFVTMWGKPVVRVPVERQVPNEADL